MDEDTFYKTDVESLAQGEISPLDIGIDLKNSEDLATDIMNYIIEIERIADWGENGFLADFYDLLRIMQQELVFSNPIVEFHSQNLHAVVAYANLLLKSGMVIGKDIPRAYELLQNTLKVQSTHEYALATLGGLLLTGCESIPRDPRKAFALFQEVLSRRPDYTFALTNLGEMLRFGDDGIEKNGKAAYHYFQRALDEDPENKAALEALAILFKAGSDFMPCDSIKSYNLFTKLLELDRYNPVALTCLAEHLLDTQEKDNIQKAVCFLEDALAVAPNHTPALAMLGNILRYERDGIPPDRIRARALLEQAIKIDPEDDYALASLGEIYMRGTDDTAENPDLAFTLFEKAYELGNRSIFCLNHLAELLHRQKEYIRAQQLLTVAYELDPNHPHTLYGLGINSYFFNDGDLEKARQYFEKVLEIDSNYYSAIHYYSYMLSISPHHEDKVKACELFLRALELEPNDPSMLAEVANLLYFTIEPKDVPRALEYITKAIHLDEESVAFHVFFALVVVQEEIEERYHEAYLHLEKAVSLEPDNTQALYFLCRFLMYGTEHVQIDLERCKAIIENVLKTNPEDSEFIELQYELIEKMVACKISQKGPLETVKRFFRLLTST